MSCVVEINASASNNTYGSPRAAVELDIATLVNPCGLDVELQPGPVQFVLHVPPGVYEFIGAVYQWDGGGNAECYLAVEDDDATTIADDIVVSTSGVSLSVGPLIIPGPYGRVYITCEFVSGTHTIDPATILTLDRTRGPRRWWAGVAGSG